MPIVISQPIGQIVQPLTPLPSRVFSEPKEGRFFVPVEIAWPGNVPTYALNMQAIALQPLSQIVMIDVDNSDSGADVAFVFPDSQDMLEVPAGSGGLFPVFTQQLQMFVSAPGALASDVTRFRVLNYRQEPIALPPPQFTNVATALSLNAAGTTAILAPGISGTLVGYSVNVSLLAGGGTGGWKGTLINTASGAVIDQAGVSVLSGASYANTMMNVSGLALRFAGGISFTIANSGTAFAAQEANVTVRYRTP